MTLLMVKSVIIVPEINASQFDFWLLEPVRPTGIVTFLFLSLEARKIILNIYKNVQKIFYL